MDSTSEMPAVMNQWIRHTAGAHPSLSKVQIRIKWERTAFSWDLFAKLLIFSDCRHHGGYVLRHLAS